MNAGMAAKKAAKKAPTKKAGGAFKPLAKKAAAKRKPPVAKRTKIADHYAIAPKVRGKGRPSSYKEEYAEQAEKLCRLGATDKELADFFEVAESTLNLWKLEHPDFSESLKRGKSTADAEVADRLFRRATGYSHKAVKFATFEGMITDQREYTEHYAPDTTACIFWLKNRRPDLWRDKVEVKAEHSGKIDGSGFSPEEDAAITDFVAGIRDGLKKPGT